MRLGRGMRSSTFDIHDMYFTYAPGYDESGGLLLPRTRILSYPIAHSARMDAATARYRSSLQIHVAPYKARPLIRLVMLKYVYDEPRPQSDLFLSCFLQRFFFT